MSHPRAVSLWLTCSCHHPPVFIYKKSFSFILRVHALILTIIIKNDLEIKNVWCLVLYRFQFNPAGLLLQAVKETHSDVSVLIPKLC